MVSKKFDFTKKFKGVLRSRRTVLFKEKRGVTVRSNDSSRLTVTMKYRLIKMMLLNNDRLIGDGASGCIHVECVKSRVVSSHASDLHRTVLIESEVHWSR